MKYLLFDLAIALSVIASGRRLLKSRGGGRPVGEAGRNETSAGSAISLPRHGDLVVGDVVEIYEPRILQSYAFFAKILKIESRGEGPVELEVRAGPNWVEVLRVDASRATAYADAYEINTRAACDGGSSLASTSKLFPCAVMAVSGRDSYHVSAWKNGEQRHMVVPLFRVRRLVEASPESDREFERVMTISRTSDGKDEDEDPSHPLWGVVELIPAKRDEEGRLRLRMHGYGFKYGAAAVVTSRHEEGGSPVGYDLQHLFADVHLTAIDPNLVRPYRIYDDGSQAMCRLGASWNQGGGRACTIVSHMIREVGFVIYKVEYLTDEGETVRRSLSFTKVQNIGCNGASAHICGVQLLRRNHASEHRPRFV